MFLTIHRENYSKERGGIFIFSFARTKKEKRKTYSDTFKLRAQFRFSLSLQQRYRSVRQTAYHPAFHHGRKILLPI